MLEVAAIETFYGETQALFGPSIRVGEAEVVALLGPNGAGKTTTIRSILGLSPPRRGEIRFDGRDITRLATHRIAQLEEEIGAKLLTRETRNITPTAPGRQLLAYVSGLGPARAQAIIDYRQSAGPFRSKFSSAITPISRSQSAAATERSSRTSSRPERNCLKSLKGILCLSSWPDSIKEFQSPRAIRDRFSYRKC